MQKMFSLLIFLLSSTVLSETFVQPRKRRSMVVTDIMQGYATLSKDLSYVQGELNQLQQESMELLEECLEHEGKQFDRAEIADLQTYRDQQKKIIQTLETMRQTVKNMRTTIHQLNQKKSD